MLSIFDCEADSRAKDADRTLKYVLQGGVTEIAYHRFACVVYSRKDGVRRAYA